MTVTPGALPPLDLTGTVMAVSSRAVGTSLATAAGAGNSSLTVVDNATVVAGDQLRLADPDTGLSETVVVVGIAGADVINLTGVTTNAYAVASTVTRVPAANEVVAFVSIIDQAEPLPVVVEHSLADALLRGTREPGQGEVVHIVRNADGDLRVVDIQDRSTTRYGITADDVRTSQGIAGEAPGAVKNYVVETFGGLSTLAGLLLESGSTPTNPNGGTIRVTSGTDGDAGSWIQSDSERVSIIARAPSEPNFDAYIDLSALHGILMSTRSGQPVAVDAPFVGSLGVHGGDIYSDGQAGTGTVPASLTNQGRLIRTPSTKRVKKNIKPLKLADAAVVLDLDAVTYRLKAEKNGPLYPGFVAEQAADAGADLWVTRDQDGEPDGFRYGEVVVAHNLIIRDLRTRVAQLEDDLTDALARLTALEGDH